MLKEAPHLGVQGIRCCDTQQHVTREGFRGQISGEGGSLGEGSVSNVPGLC